MLIEFSQQSWEVGIIPAQREGHRLKKVKQHPQDQVGGPDPDPGLHDSKPPYTSLHFM